MATNKLMEAAADILSGSKKSAPAMPPQKLEGEVVDLGGPTPQNSKPDDDSNKIHATKAAKSATAPTTKPSAASGKIQTLSQEEFDDLSEEEQDLYLEQLDQLDELSTKLLAKAASAASDPDAERNYDKSHDPQKFADHAAKRKDAKSAAAVQGAADAKGHYPRPGHTFGTDKLASRTPTRVTAAGKANKQDVSALKNRMKNEEFESNEISFQEDVDALFADDSTISEEFKAKAATIFEARVLDRVNQIQEQLESEYASMLEEAVDSVKNELTEKVDDYLNYVVEQWLSDNEIAIESGLRAELTEEFIAGLRNLFAEHYIDVPSEKVDLVGELAGKVEELESKLNEEIERGIEYKKALIEAVKQEITREVCEGLTETQVEKIKALAESVDFSTEEEYQSKLETIRENYFPSGVRKADATQLHEQVEDGTENKVVSNDPYVSAVAKAISKTKI